MEPIKTPYARLSAWCLGAADSTLEPAIREAMLEQLLVEHYLRAERRRDGIAYLDDYRRAPAYLSTHRRSEPADVIDIARRRAIETDR